LRVRANSVDAEKFFYLLPPYGPQKFEKALESLLYNDMRQISLLKELVVLDGSSENETPINFAQEAVEWFRERTRQRALEAVEEEWRKLSE
jgi:hypothetical protein